MIKATKDQLSRAAEIMLKYNIQKVWLNTKGEFFTQENLALHSVKGEKAKLVAIGEDVTVKTLPTLHPDGPELRGSDKGKAKAKAKPENTEWDTEAETK
jgi:hypothetical protein